MATIKRKPLMKLAVGLEGGLIVLAWVLGLLLDPPAFASFRITGAAIGWGALAILPVLAGLGVTLRSQWPPFRQLREDLQRLVGMMFSELTVADMALISILAGLGEEALFRGFLQPAIANSTGLLGAVIISNVVFGLLHLISVPYGVLAFGIGLYFSWLQIVSGNLLVPALAHGGYDFIALVYLVYIRKSEAGAAAPAETPADH